MRLRGNPGRAWRPSTSSASPEFGARLWALAEEKTVVRVRILGERALARGLPVR